MSLIPRARRLSMSAEEDPSKQLPRTKRNTISTDAALFTATFIAFLLDSAISESVGKDGGGSDASQSADTGAAFQAAVAASCDHAADMLSRVLFGERLFRRLDLDDPRHV